MFSKYYRHLVTEALPHVSIPFRMVYDLLILILLLPIAIVFSLISRTSFFDMYKRILKGTKESLDPEEITECNALLMLPLMIILTPIFLFRASCRRFGTFNTIAAPAGILVIYFVVRWICNCITYVKVNIGVIIEYAAYTVIMILIFKLLFKVARSILNCIPSISLSSDSSGSWSEDIIQAKCDYNERQRKEECDRRKAAEAAAWQERQREKQAAYDRKKAADTAAWHQKRADELRGTYDGYVHQNRAAYYRDQSQRYW